MNDRMKIGNGEKCDIEFGSKLESLMNEMEQNKDATEEVANKLKTQFKVLLKKEQKELEILGIRSSENPYLFL